MRTQLTTEFLDKSEEFRWISFLPKKATFAFGI